MSSGSGDTGLKTEQAKFDYLASVDIKFMNYARNSLVCGEKVIASIWQPEIRERGLILLGWSYYRTRSLAHLTILTDQEVILIRDAEYSRGNKGLGYGTVWRYIPLHNIQSVLLAEQANDGLSLILALSPDARLELVFTVSRKHEAENFRNEIEKLIR
jgi:hypothetical protein